MGIIFSRFVDNSESGEGDCVSFQNAVIMIDKEVRA
jgi:hypothetical protein